MEGTGAQLYNFRRLLSLVLLLAGVIFPQNPPAASLTIYINQLGTPTAIPNFVDPGAGCQWLGVGGQVFNQMGQPVNGMILVFSGILDGTPIGANLLTGSSVQFGPGGFDLKLSDHPILSYSVKMRLYDLAGKALSYEITIPTFDTCNRNLTIINLVQSTFTNFEYLPLLRP